MASLVTKFFTTHVGKDVGNAQPKGRGISPTTSRTLRGSTSFVQCPADTVPACAPRGALVQSNGKNKIQYVICIYYK